MRAQIALALVAAFVVVSVSVTSISAQSQIDIPAWVKGIANFWVEGNISDTEFGDSISFLIEQNIIRVEMPDDSEWKSEADKLYRENQLLEGDIGVLENDVSRLMKEKQNFQKASEQHYDWYIEEFDYAQSLETQYNQLYNDYVYLYNLVSGQNTKPPEIITEPSKSASQPTQSSCDPSYPDVCIPPYPPDLDCGEIGYSNFRVVGNDPHGFDADYDGIGCEVGSPQSSNPVESTQECDPSYPDVCIPPYPPDLDCGEIGYSNFRVVGNDPHGFDRDKDGIGCES